MNRRTLHIVLLTVVVTALVATGVGLLATRSEPTPSAVGVAVKAQGSPARIPAPPPTTIAAPPPQLTVGRAGPDRLSAAERLDTDKVALTAVAAVNSFDTAKDQAQIDGARRALYLLTDDLGFALTKPKADGASAEWQVWAYTEAWSELTVIRGELPWALPADTSTTAVRVVVMKREIHTEGRVEREEPETYQLTLNRPAADTGWRVDTIEVP